MSDEITDSLAAALLERCGWSVTANDFVGGSDMGSVFFGLAQEIVRLRGEAQSKGMKIRRGPDCSGKLEGLEIAIDERRFTPNSFESNFLDTIRTYSEKYGKIALKPKQQVVLDKMVAKVDLAGAGGIDKNSVMAPSDRPGIRAPDGHGCHSHGNDWGDDDIPF